MRPTYPLLILCAGLLGAAPPANSGSEPATTAPSPLPSLEAAEERGTRAIEPRIPGEPSTVLLSGATVMTAAGTIHSPGYLLLREGKIAAIGAGEAPADAAAEAHRIDATGHWITPGLIDTHSHLGVYPSPGARAHSDGNEATSPTTPGVWAEHSFWPQDPGLFRALAGGITALQILPGSANLIGGRGVVLSVVPARGSRAMRFVGAPETVKMACGENPKRVYGERGGPSTRMGNLRGVRSAFLKAEAHLRSLEEHAEEAKKGRKKAKPTKKGEADEGPDDAPRDLDMETLVGVLRGEILPQVHCYRADDMLSMLQVADEFGFSIRSFHHALEAYKIRDILAEREVASSTWADWWGFKLEAYDGIQENAALLADAGAIAIIHSDSAIGIQRLNQEAGKAYHFGLQAGIELAEDEALRWVTRNPAWALGIDDETGSLEVGKRADVVVWDQHPFSVYSQTRYVFVGGELRFDRERSQNNADFLVGEDLKP